MKAMKKSKYMYKKDKFNLILLMLMFIVTITYTVGYGALNQELKISGEAAYRVSADIRITNVSISEIKDGAAESYKYYGKNTINLGLDFPNNTSQISYKVDITNFSDVEHYISNIEINNPNVKYEIKLLDSGGNEQDFNIPVGNMVPDINVIKNASNANNVTKTYKITFSCNETASDVPVLVKFSFSEVYKISIKPNPSFAIVRMNYNDGDNANKVIETKEAYFKKGTEINWEVYTTDGNYHSQNNSDVIVSNLDRNVVLEGHTFDAWSVVSGPTCTEPGVEKRTCSLGDKTETRYINALGHNYDYNNPRTVSPSFSGRGYNEYTCSNNSSHKEQSPIYDSLYIVQNSNVNSRAKDLNTDWPWNSGNPSTSLVDRSTIKGNDNGRTQLGFGQITGYSSARPYMHVQYTGSYAVFYIGPINLTGAKQIYFAAEILNDLCPKQSWDLAGVLSCDGKYGKTTVIIGLANNSNYRTNSDSAFISGTTTKHIFTRKKVNDESLKITPTIAINENLDLTNVYIKIYVKHEDTEGSNTSGTGGIGFSEIRIDYK